jgi:hypothetical protein
MDLIVIEYTTTASYFCSMVLFGLGFIGLGIYKLLESNSVAPIVVPVYYCIVTSFVFIEMFSFLLLLAVLWS